MDHQKLNWLRAGVLGANDGIISVAVLLVSITGILPLHQILIIGIGTIIGGALSMALGEYVSVAAQRDAETKAKETHLTNPFHAALSSFLAFVSGAFFPLLLAVITQNPYAIIASVYLALTLTTFISVKVGNVTFSRPFFRNITGGTIALIAGLILNHFLNVT